MIKAIVFDLDDTLISEYSYIESGFKVISEKISYDFNRDRELLYETMINVLNTSSQNVFNRVLDYFRLEYNNSYINELIKLYRNHIPNIEFYPDVMPIIEDLKNKGYKLGIITDGYKETQRAKLEALNCQDLFDCIIITDEIGYWKPHQKPYIIMAEKLNCLLEEMVYIGDNEQKDFITANRLLIRTIKINRENAIYRDINLDFNYKAQIEINSLINLSEFLERIERNE